MPKLRIKRGKLTLTSPCLVLPSFFLSELLSFYSVSFALYLHYTSPRQVLPSDRECLRVAQPEGNGGTQLESSLPPLLNSISHGWHLHSCDGVHRRRTPTNEDLPALDVPLDNRNSYLSRDAFTLRRPNSIRLVTPASIPYPATSLHYAPTTMTRIRNGIHHMIPKRNYQIFGLTQIP